MVGQGLRGCGQCEGRGVNKTRSTGDHKELGCQNLNLLLYMEVELCLQTYICELPGRIKIRSIYRGDEAQPGPGHEAGAQPHCICLSQLEWE